MISPQFPCSICECEYDLFTLFWALILLLHWAFEHGFLTRTNCPAPQYLQLLYLLSRFLPKQCVSEENSWWNFLTKLVEPWLVLRFLSSFQNQRIHKLMPLRDWLLLRRSPRIAFPMKKFPNLFLTLQRFLIFVLESIFETPRTISSQWVSHLYFWLNAGCLSHLVLRKTAAFMVEDINIHLMRECLSMSSILSPGGRFLIIRNLVFTHSMNEIDTAEREDLYSLHASNSTSVTESHATGFSVLAIDLASVCHSWEFHILSPLFDSDVSHNATSFSVLPIRSNSRLSDLKIPGLADAIEIGIVEDPARLLDTKFLTGFDLAAILSSQSPSCNLFDIAWVQHWELNRLMLHRHRRWFHSSRVKFALVGMSASWFLVSTYLIWTVGCKLILSNNWSSATLWVLATCFIVGLLLLIVILMTASLSSTMYNWDSPWEERVFAGTWSTHNKSASSVVFRTMFGCAFGFVPVLCQLGATTEVALLCVERNTYNIPQVESRGTVLLQTGIQRYDFRFCRNVWHWSLLFASLVYIYIYIYEINRAQRRSQAWLRWVTDRASLLTDHRMSGLPILARYNHFQTICEHTCDSSPIDSSSSFLKLWSFKQGPETFYKLLCLFVRQFAMSFHAFLSMSFHVVGRRHSFCVRLLSSW